MSSRRRPTTSDTNAMDQQAPGYDDDNDDGGPLLNPDVATLHSWWLQEEASPEIMPFQQNVVDDLVALVSTCSSSRSRRGGGEG